ncbi:MAG: Gfo/Idh/MocA family oxidoreductase [Chloroflexota bacterium]|nr:Gfo/Idh/MocA family oxidoreductase [Chloroflexota bacterium]
MSLRSPEAPTRVAMIGAGRMARRVHYPSLASFPDVEIAAIAELDAEKLADAADAYRVERRFKDYREMIERTSPDAVYSIGPPHVMYDTWVWCLQQGINLFVEKPLGVTLHQAEMLADLAARHGAITQVDFQRRTTPVTVAARERCLERGPITHTVVRFYKNEQRPFTGALDHMLDDGTHAIDTLRWLCGGDVTSIQCQLKRVGTPDINFITATLDFSTGAVGVLLASWSSGRRIFSVEMHAPGICAEVDPEESTTIYADGDTNGTVTTSQEAAGSDAFHVFGGFRAKNREFIDAVRSGTQPSSNFQDALTTMQTAHRILAQATLANA